jgi:acetylornithine deacetylase/succinyl-diaminopimelate desuccinylase-like protein
MLQASRYMTVLAALALGLSLPASADAKSTPSKVTAQALEILGKSVGFRTVEGQGQVPAYAAYLAEVLKAGGFSAGDIEIAPHGETATLLARYRGGGSKKPIVLSGHMDVVEARAEDWGRDPFTMTADKGYLYGRGVEDNKFDVSMMVATLARLKAEGFMPSRDIILALSGDEETKQATTEVLARQLKGSELVLNGDAGGGTLAENGKPIVYSLQAAEKTYADFEINLANPGGHSSRPTKDNAIYALAAALDRLAGYEFPVQSSELTREFFRVTGEQTKGELGEAMRRFAANPMDAAAAARLSADPEYIGKVRTTCVATMVKAGHARNALPQSAVANVNCRIFPGVSVESVQKTLVNIVDDPQAKVSVVDTPVASEASPLRADVMAAVRKAIDRRFPGLAIAPEMSSGASDSLVFRNAGVPSYGVSALFIKPSDEFSHGLNERVPRAAIAGALDQWHTVLTELAR